MNKVTDHRNDPWNGNDPWNDPPNPDSRVARTLKVIGKVLAVLFKVTFYLVFAIAKLWAAMDDGQKEKDPMQKAEEEQSEHLHYVLWNRRFPD